MVDLDLDKLTADQQDQLDFLVDDLVSKQASAINNAGPKAQVDYLLSQGMSLEDIANEISDQHTHVWESADGTYETCNYCHLRRVKRPGIQ